MAAKNERRQLAESLNNSMQRTFATGLPLSRVQNDYQDSSFSNTLYDGTPGGRHHGVLGRKRSEERTNYMRDELLKQIAGKEDQKRLEK